MCSSTPLWKEISTFAVLIVQALLPLAVDDVEEYETLFSEYNVTGTIVSFCCGIKKHLLKLMYSSYEEALRVYMRYLIGGLLSNETNHAFFLQLFFLLNIKTSYMK